MCQECLIAETDPFIAKLLLRFAEECGLSAFQVQIGMDLVSLARSRQPKLIILDPELPGPVRGWKLIEILRMDSGTRQFPIITCSWLEKNEIYAYIGEMDGYLRKPDLHFEDFKAELYKVGIEAEK